MKPLKYPKTKECSQDVREIDHVNDERYLPSEA